MRSPRLDELVRSLSPESQSPYLQPPFSTIKEGLAQIDAGGSEPCRTRRATPYLYSDADIARLMEAARGLTSPLRAATYETLLGLLAVTGMRVGEAIRLERDDLDLINGLLTVRASKFGKSREIPLHPSTLEALGRYARQRERLRPGPKTRALFVSIAGTPLIYSSVQHTFQQLVRRAGVHRRSPRCRPRLHDLRHTFAVNTLLG